MMDGQQNLDRSFVNALIQKGSDKYALEKNAT